MLFRVILVRVPTLNVAGLQFVTQALVPTIIACDSEHTELWCCTLGYTQLVWQKLMPTSGEWSNVTLGRWVHMKEDNQTLALNLVIPMFDETKYRCTARNESGYEISHTMDLDIRGQYHQGSGFVMLQPQWTHGVIVTTSCHDVVLV